MKNTLLYAIALISLVLFTSCANDQKADYPAMSSYAELHQEILSTEFNIYSNNETRSLQHLDNITDLLKDSKKLFCPFQNDKVNQAIALVKSLKDKLPIADLNYQLDQLRLIKRDIYNIDTDQEIDFFVLYLWHYEEQMYHSTEIAMDPKLSLLEWREFVDEVKCLSESWDILNHHYPSPETLDYDQLRYKTQVILKDELKQATQAFTTLVIYGQADLGIVSQSAKYLRRKYVEYLDVIVNDPMNHYVYQDGKI